MKSSVIIFPGSNCDRDMDVALKKFGFKNQMIWHNDNSIPKSDLIVLPGGFSYGDYLRCGSIASKSKIIKSVIDFANSGGLVLGVCNGFQILTETGLLPGILQQNKYLNFICKNVFVKVKDKQNKYFKDIKKNNLNLSNNVQMLGRMIKTHQHYHNIQQMKKVVQKSWMLSKDHKLDYYNKNLKRLFQYLLNFLYLGQQPSHFHTLVKLVK